MKKNICSIALAFFIVLFFVSCNEKGKVRKSTEEDLVSVKTKIDPVGKAVSPHGEFKQKKKILYSWDTPEGWEIGNSTSNIRLATFEINDAGAKVICTIIPLIGDGGGLEPNVKLWLEQVGIKMDLKTNELKHFISKSERFKTKNGQDVIMIDTTPLQKQDMDESIIVSLIKIDNFTIFIKLKGKKSILEKNREKLLSLSESFRKKEDNGK